MRPNSKGIGELGNVLENTNLFSEAVHMEYFEESVKVPDTFGNKFRFVFGETFTFIVRRTSCFEQGGQV